MYRKIRKTILCLTLGTSCAFLGLDLSGCRHLLAESDPTLPWETFEGERGVLEPLAAADAFDPYADPEFFYER